MEKLTSKEAPPGRRIVLIVEDEWLLATDLTETVESAGYAVLGPAYSVSAALALVDSSSRIEGGLLDVDLGGETSYPVAEALAKRGIPFAFLSGYAANQLRSDFEGHPLLSKPINANNLRTHLSTMMRPA